jgi:hypothetical protein
MYFSGLFSVTLGIVPLNPHLETEGDIFNEKFSVLAEDGQS